MTWKKIQLSEVATIVMGQSPTSENYNEEKQGIPLIQGNSDISEHKTLQRIYTTQITREVEKGELIMTVRAPVGDFAFTSTRCCIGRGFCHIKTDKKMLVRYNLEALKKRWKVLEQGSTFTAVNGTDIKGFQINIPTHREEQQAIVEVLEVWDEVVVGLREKIALKRAVKRGLMQQLLTGRTRLPGFSGEWVTYALEEAYVFLQNSSLSRACLSTNKSSMKYIHYGDIHKQYPCILESNNLLIPYVLESKIQANNRDSYSCRTGDLLIADASEDYKDVGKAVEVIVNDSLQIIAGLHTMHLRPDLSLVAPYYGGYLFQNVELKRTMQKLATGVSVLGLSKSSVKKIKINLPPLPEQQAIAAVLTAADEEIEALEGKLALIEEQRKYLLNELVTCKTRLPGFAD